MLWPMHTYDFDCLIPDWPAPPNVLAVCTTRYGGASSGRYASLNLGLHVGDDLQMVANNRLRLQSALGVRPVFLEQVHGTAMVTLDAQVVDGMKADAAATEQSGLACTVMVADCLPVLLCDVQGSMIAVAHAGWRGLLGVNGKGVLENAVAGFGPDRLALPDGVLAWLGPCIGPDAFEVGDEVRAAFLSASPKAEECFQPKANGKWLADLPALAKQRLAALGIAQTFGNDGGQGWCTFANASRFFSHRRDGVSGRMAACIWRV